ncbi:MULTISPECIES: hypothetical protein [unclassified Streptomyces]|nr:MULTISPECIES: hypothetical protein [unclassified Streptomyces]MYQ81455.1 hypothetical protein [Streptomyces sp. SID4923]
MVQLAADGKIFDWVSDTIDNVQTLAVSAALAMAIVGTVMAYVKTKSWAGTLTAAILGAVVVFAVGNMDALSNMVDSEVPDAPKDAISVVQPYEPPATAVGQADLL